MSERLAKIPKERYTTYHAESTQRVQLDQAMKVPKQDRGRQKHQIRGLAHEEADELDDLGEQHEGELQAKCDPLMLGRPVLRRLDGQEDDERIEDEG